MNSFPLRPGRFTALAAVLLSFVAALANAQPRVQFVEGDLKEGAPFGVHGDGFGDKPTGRPVLFADFEKDINPNPSGQKKKWDRIENMTWSKEGPDGAGCAVAADGSGTWTMMVKRDAWSKEGEKAYVFRRQRLNFTVSNESQNWKVWRMWPEDGSTPNIYAAGHNNRIYVENVGQESGFWGKVYVPTIDWVNEEIMFQASNNGVKDGVFWFKCNGVDMAQGTVMTRSPQAPEYMTKNFAVHGVAANTSRWSPPWSPNNRLWVDEVYVDTVWSRVMLGDKPLRREGRIWEIEIPVKWTDSAIELEAHPGIFKPGQTAYLFVFDADGHANDVGYPVRIGSSPTELARATDAHP